MTANPFAGADDPVRRFRGRLGGAVSLWTTGEGAARTGLTVSSLMVANGEPDKTIWITEMGWGLDLVTDDSRAAYLRRAVELVRSWPYVRTFCVYTLSQDVGPDAQSFGLIATSGTPSQSWVSYIAAARGR